MERESQFLVLPLLTISKIYPLPNFKLNKLKTSRYLSYKDSTIHYIEYKGGDRTLICFHGYGQKAEWYENLWVNIRSKYTLLSIDLFYHGKSSWPNCEKPLEENDLHTILTQLMKRHSFDTFCLCGYSMGGKIALKLVEIMSNNIEYLILIAPDGVRTNFWYNLSTYPYGVRRLFKQIIDHPSLFYKLSTALCKLGLLHRGIGRFAQLQMDSRSKREKLYCTWLTYRKMKPNMNTVVSNLNESNISAIAFFGRYDKIIQFKKLNPILKKLNMYRAVEIDTGHNTLIDDVASQSSHLL